VERKGREKYTHTENAHFFGREILGFVERKRERNIAN